MKPAAHLDTANLAGDQVESLAISAASAGPTQLTLTGLNPFRSARVRGMEMDTGIVNLLVDDIKVAHIVLFADGLEDE